MQGGKHLALIEQQFGIERAFQALLLLEIGLGEHLWHTVALFDADSRFAGKDAADLDAQLQYIAAERLCAVELSGDVGVIEDQRVKIAVSRMEHVGDLEIILPGELLYFLKNFRKPPPGDRPVHAIKVRRDPSDRGKRRLAPRPETHAFLLVARKA